MKLQCPHCGEPIAASNINIQEMVAVCDACNQVFEFSRDVVGRKRKAVLPLQPARLKLEEDDGELVLAYSRVFGSGPLLGTVMSFVGGIVFMVMALGMAREAAPSGIIALTLLLSTLMWYVFAFAMTTTTRIMAADHDVTITSGPLPFPIKDDKRVSLREIQRVFMEQTFEAMSGGVPANHVYAELRDGSRVRLLSSLPHDYAYYIAQVINEHVQTERALPQASGEILDAADDALDPLLVEAIQAEKTQAQQAPN